MASSAKIILKNQERCIGCYNCVFACSLELFKVISATRSAVSLKPCSPETPFIVNFCTSCEDPPCISACEEGALELDTDGKVVLAKPTECDVCETFECVPACITGALSIDPEEGRPMLCTQCGKCADVCPHEVIVFEEVD